MSFSEHKIANFTHRISDLPDQPDLSPADLKARFDSAPEQLRQALGAVCDDAQRLDDRVSGIVAETFGDAIPKSMLAEELQSEIEGKAEQATVAEIDARLLTQEGLTMRKCEVFFGTYIGDGAESQTISLDFTPSVLLTCTQRGTSGTVSGYEYTYGGICAPDYPAGGTSSAVTIVENGFVVKQLDKNYVRANKENTTYYYIAFR